MNQRELEVNIKVTENEFYVLVEDSESGEYMNLGPYDYSDQERGRFDKELGDEIYSWISIAREGIIEESSI